MIVVNAVDDEVHPPPGVVVGLPVKEQAVQPVLGQGPDAEPADRQRDQLQCREAAVSSEPLHGYDHRDEDDRRDRGVDPGEEVQEGAVEELRGGR